MITYISITREDTHTPAQAIAQSIRWLLDSGQSVLWLVSGGSAISVAVQARKLLGALGPTDTLHVALVDERFGEKLHGDSNEWQLRDAGFDMTGVQFHPVLIGSDIKTTTKDYQATLEEVAASSDSTIGLFGMGSDGHTAGLLPRNPLMGSKLFVGNFDGPDYQRITVTPSFISQIDHAILYAVGPSKWPVIETLQTTDLPVACLRSVKDLSVYSDYPGVA